MIKFAAMFGVLGLALAAMAVAQAGGAAGVSVLGLALEGWVAVCFWVLAALYGLRCWGIPVEDALLRTGGRTVVLRVAVAPYLLLAALVLAITRRLDREQPRSLVAPGVWIGRLPSASEYADLPRAGITAVLSLCWEFVPPSRRGRDQAVAVAWEPILDAAPPTERQFQVALERVNTWRSEGRTILIHCAQGHGRSATIAAAALVATGRARDMDQALAQIQSARPRARLSPQQRDALQRFLRTSLPSASR
jgi:hypothetical protein